MPIKKKRIDKKTIASKIKFIDSERFMSRSLSSFVNDFKDCECRFKHETIKNYEKEFDEDLKKRFTNTYKFCTSDFNKFGLLWQEGIYPYEYMKGCEKLSEVLLPEKMSFILA